MQQLIDHPIDLRQPVSRAAVVTKRKRRRRRRAVVLTIFALMTGLLAAATVAWAWRTQVVASRWQTRGEQLTADLQAANDALRTANSQVEARTADLNDLRPRTVAAEATARTGQDQLSAAQAELQSLAAAKAALGDREKVLRATLNEGAGASTELERCIGSLVTAGSVAAAGADTLAACDAALAHGAAFRAGVKNLGQ